MYLELSEMCLCVSVIEKEIKLISHKAVTVQLFDLKILAMRSYGDMFGFMYKEG